MIGSTFPKHESNKNEHSETLELEEPRWQHDSKLGRVKSLELSVKCLIIISNSV